MEKSKRKLDEVIVDSEDDEEEKSKRKSSKKSIESPTKPSCQYGSKCYRKNPTHLAEFSHNHNVDEDDDIIEIKPSTSKPSTSNATDLSSRKIYLTKIHHVSNAVSINSDFSLSLKDILLLNEGEFVESAQFNYMHDIEWLMEQYPVKNRTKPLTLIHGSRSHDELGDVKSYSNLKLVKAKLDSPYGTHHTKMMFLLYKSGMRVVVHTANLIEQDWAQKTQGIWISEMFPKIDGEKINPNKFDSKTNFKKYLIVYLESYNDKHLNEWIDHIKKHDMSSANVFLIGSVPGRFSSTSKIFGHPRLRKVLSEHFKRTDDSDSADHLVAQFSSIGSLGPNENNWLCKEFLASLSTVNNSSLAHNKITKPKLIYPTVENVRTSYEGYSAGGSLPYSKNTAAKQTYLKNFLFKWKSEGCKRTRASPHIKSYARCSHDFKKVYWFLLTSANLSKAAWGNFEKNESQYLIRSYELGVLFIPSFLNENGKNYFETDNRNEFLIPYDLPPEKYDSKDEPWIVDISYTDKEDSHDRLWKIM